MKSHYDAIVIGSGLGGLTAGALLARAGHEVLVLEKNPGFGGAASTFERGGHRFEVSLHETTLPGSGADPKAAVFRALDLDAHITFVPIETFQEIRSPVLGAPLTLPHGLDAVEAALAARFPDRREAIHRFLRQIDRSQEALAVFAEKHGGHWWLGHAADLPLDLWALVRDMRSSLSEVLERYFGKDELLKLVLTANLPYYGDDPDRLWWLAYAIAQGGFLSGGGYYIKGGSGKLTEALVEVIRDTGGEALTGRRVTHVLTDEAGRATGVRFQTGADDVAEVSAPVIFANAAPQAVAQMLDEPLRDDFLAPYAGRDPSISLFSVQYALSRPASDLGVTSYSTVLLPDWMQTPDDFRAAAPLLGAAPGDRLPPLIAVDYGQIDSGLAEDGPAPFSVTGVDRLENWEDLSETAYAARKSEWIGALTQRLDAEWPGFAAAVTSAEMMTARSMRDVLGTPGGAVHGFAPEPPSKLLSGPPSTVRSSVPGLWIASAWSGFGGFTGAMSGGAMAARAALRRL